MDDFRKIGAEALNRMKQARMTRGTRIEVAEWGALAESLGRTLAGRAAFLAQAGALMQSRVSSTFRTQGRGDVKWPARKVPNIAGILSDFEAGRSQPRPRRFEARPALHDTGRLGGSISFRVVGEEYAEVGTTVPYAAKHQNGFREVRTVTESIKQRLAKYLRKHPVFEEQLGYLRGVKEVRVSAPARPFVFFTAQDREDLRRLAASIFAGGKR